jgi:diacylglycerol O-acyltransferase / wax synthase
MSDVRLSALDASFLAAETPTAHMHVGWAAVFDPPADAGSPSFEELRDHIASRLARAPRYRQRLAEVPLGIADPVWVDDDRFDVDRHVIPASGPTLDSIVAEAMSARLERTRPLWEVWINPRLDGGRVGLVGKVHHCMVDGLAAVELASLLLDPTPSPPEETDGWNPRPAPGRVELVINGLANRVRQPLDVASLATRVVTSPARVTELASKGQKAGLALVNTFRRRARPLGLLNDRSSSLRHIGRLRRSLDDLRTIKSRFGTTINDVVLAVSAGGMRRLLEDHDEPTLALKAMVPASLRGASEADALGNRISFLFVDLPVDEADPVDRLREINRVTSARKAAGEPEGGEAVLSAMGYTPHLVQRALTRLIAHPWTFNLVVSNIPGPREPLWMRGCPLREVYPIVPIADGHALSIGVTTLEDEMFFGLYADRKLMPDTDRLAKHIGDEIDLLLEVALQPTEKGRENGQVKRREREQQPTEGDELPDAVFREREPARDGRDRLHETNT